MYTIRARNVNDAFEKAIELIRQVGVQEETRNGPALVAPGPVLTIYERPWERVLFDEERDANPFLHMFESLWMLGGRNDVSYLTRFAKNFANYAESDGRMHGAYGHRWSNHFGMDQLNIIVEELSRDPGSRQAVLQMWDANADLGVRGLKDRPCNTQVYFRVRSDPYRGVTDQNSASIEQAIAEGRERRVLDMTVTCRSNDIVWGAYGANAVHFSVLQEYMAARIGVEIGRYYQFSNNWHGYLATIGKFEPKRFAGQQQPYESWEPWLVHHYMFSVPTEANRDIQRWFDAGNDPWAVTYGNPWLNFTAVPMWVAHAAWKSGAYESAMKATDEIQALDWRKAAKQWITRRQEKTT